MSKEAKIYWLTLGCLAVLTAVGFFNQNPILEFLVATPLIIGLFLGFPLLPLVFLGYYALVCLPIIIYRRDRTIAIVWAMAAAAVHIVGFMLFRTGLLDD